METRQIMLDIVHHIRHCNIYLYSFYVMREISIMQMLLLFRRM